MKAILCLFVLALAPCGRADQEADRKAIHDFLAGLNEPRDAAAARPVAAFFTSGAPESEIERLTRLVAALDDARQPWMELDSPHIGCRGIRFVTAEIALADCSVAAGFGSVLRGARLLFVMKKEPFGWRIASFRELR